MPAARGGLVNARLCGARGGRRTGNLTGVTASGVPLLDLTQPGLHGLGSRRSLSTLT
jgi:hypothetical protein